MRFFKSSDEFYRSREWNELRKLLILENIKKNGNLVCQDCGKTILKDYECIAHHIQEITQQNLNDINVTLNKDNIRLICFSCHNLIHKRFSGERYREVYLVCGSPCSGKSTFVKNNATKDSLIVDLDTIYEMIGVNQRYVNNPRLKSVVFEVRNSLYESIKMRRGKWDDAYVITTEPFLMARKRLAEMLGAKIIMIEATKEECLKNLYADKDRVLFQKDWEGYINDFFEKYQPEEVM